MTPDIHTLSGAYALDAIESDERAAFEAHLAECESCRDEVDALRVAAVSLVEPMTPPPGLRARVLAAAEQTPQLPPLVDRPAHVVRRRWLPRLLVAAAALVVAAGVGVALSTNDEPSGLTAADVFDAPDAQEQTVAVEGGELRVAASDHLGRIAVDASDLPALPSDRDYQLWLVRDGEATSLSVLEDDVTTAVSETPDTGVLAMTEEPAGGSDQPTSEPIVTLDPTDL